MTVLVVQLRIDRYTRAKPDATQGLLAATGSLSYVDIKILPYKPDYTSAFVVWHRWLPALHLAPANSS